MSRPRYIFYNGLKKLILIGYYKTDTQQAHNIYNAMQTVNAITQSLEDGSDRMRAIEQILIDNKSYKEVALALNQPESVIKLWVSQYINLVGIKAGF